MDEPTRKTDAEVFEDAINGVSQVDTESQALYAAAVEIAAAYGMSVEEAAGAVERLLNIIRDAAKSLAVMLEDLTRALEVLGAASAPPPSKLRRQWEKDRARQIEAVYGAKIKRFKRFKPYRRVYIPP